MVGFEIRIREEFQKRWANPEDIIRENKNIDFGWHFGYYETGVRTYKKAILNMNNYIDRLLEINDNSRILDAGCGVGATTAFLAKKHSKSIFYGITLSSNEIKCAEELKRKYNLKNTKFFQKSFNLTDFPDEFFDSIYALESASFSKDIVMFIKEMNRILKQNGKLIIIDIFKKYNLPNQFCKNLRNKVIEEKKSKNFNVTIDVLKGSLSKEGFENINIRNLIKSKNIKFSHLYFFLFQRTFRNVRYYILEKKGKKRHRSLFYIWWFIYYFLIKYIIIIVSGYRYFSIVTIKK